MERSHWLLGYDRRKSIDLSNLRAKPNIIGSAKRVFLKWKLFVDVVFSTNNIESSNNIKRDIPLDFNSYLMFGVITKKSRILLQNKQVKIDCFMYFNLFNYCGQLFDWKMDWFIIWCIENQFKWKIL